MGENEYGESGHFSIFTINDAFEVQIFQGLIFSPYQRH